MPIDADLLMAAPAASPAGIYGGRWAGRLAGAMLLLMGGVTLLRWVGDGPSALEKTVEQPIPTEALISAPRPDLPAPDPGDDTP